MTDDTILCLWKCFRKWQNGGENANIMQNKFNWPLWHWHFEISSICTLKCPRCPRTELKESLVQTQLDIDFFKENFKLADDIKKITFCGDDGDPIYAKDFLPVVRFFKEQNPTVNINIVTNGSYKSLEWWKELAGILNEYDEIHFSLDGWDQESNEKYRVNSNWESIINGISLIRANSNVYMSWDLIVFAFNQDHIDLIYNNAKFLGFDQLQITYSTKFGSKYENYLTDNKDLLEPSSSFVSNTHRFQRKIIKITDRQNLIEPAVEENVKKYKEVYDKYQHEKIIPLCLIGTKGIFVNSQGYMIPCCWVGNRYNHTGRHKFLKPEFNIKEKGLESVLNSPSWTNFFSEFNSMSECNTKCIKNLVNESYATSW